MDGAEDERQEENELRGERIGRDGRDREERTGKPLPKREGNERKI